MKIETWFVGKTAFDYLNEGCAIYAKRLSHYNPFEVVILPDVKNPRHLTTEQICEQEGAAILRRLTPDDCLILLDERGAAMTSPEFSVFLEKRLGQSARRLVFLVGGAYGFSDAVYARANTQISLSRLTFSHQMVRLFLLEQLYRAFSISNNEPYHHA